MKEMFPFRQYFKFQSIRWKLLFFLTMVVIIGLVATVIWTTRVIRIEANLAALEKAKGDLRLGEALLESRYPGSWSIREDKLYKGEHLINNDNTIVDKVGHLTGDTCTIFQGNTRVATNVIRNGSRAVGTKVSDEVGRVVLEQGGEFFGEAEVVGVKYMTAYKPIRDETGRIIGMWYVGANKQFVDRMVMEANFKVIQIFCIVLLAITLVIWLLTNSFTYPIEGLVQAANRLANGDLDTKITIGKNDEIGRLAKTFEKMREVLKNQYYNLQKTNEMLQVSERRFREMLESVHLASVIMDTMGGITFCNDFLLKITGWKREEVIGLNWFDIFVPPDQRETAKEAVKEVREGTLDIYSTSEIMTKSGGHLLISWNNTYLRGIDGSIVGMARIGEDITERRIAEEKLHAAHRQLLDIIEFLPDATFVVDSNKKVIAWNKAIEEMTGVPKKDVIGKGEYVYAQAFYGEKKPVLIDLIFSDAEIVKKHCKFIEQKGNMLYAEFYVQSVFGGKGALLWATASPLFDSNGNFVGAIESIRDITKRKEMEQQLQYLATHDVLTSIPNRYFLNEALKRAVAKAKRGEKGFLLLIDLDNFKLVNDTFGHAIGDELLVNVGHVFKNNLREGDLLARLGGDEFVVLLERTTFAEANIVAEKLRQAVGRNEFQLAEHKCCLNISVSIGLAAINGTLDAQKILSYADNALYTSKEGGRNRISYVKPDEDMATRFSETNQIVSLIKEALKEDGFILYLQPVVKVKDGSVIHHEALIRLKDKSGELITPDDFVPVAERFGLMPRIDRWVVQATIKTLGEHPGIKIFVNLSGLSLGDDTLLELIEEKINESQIDPARLGFEITETAVVKDLTRAERWIYRLKKLGCRFALDDFGIGFSSFSYLNNLPVDYLKIDGSYVRNLHLDSTHLVLVQAMNSVAHALKKETIAEFVENEKVLKILSDLKIDCGQGYYLGRPAPVHRR
jgi:diguanylate cyclase (GGDEF)-like protein/PAS domain S-box-containing protein